MRRRGHGSVGAQWPSAPARREERQHDDEESKKPGNHELSSLCFFKKEKRWLGVRLMARQRVACARVHGMAVMRD
jgi:hypothetical protein